MQGWVDLVGLVIYRGGIPAQRWSSIPVLTGFKVEYNFIHATNDATAMPSHQKASDHEEHVTLIPKGSLLQQMQKKSDRNEHLDNWC